MQSVLALVAALTWGSGNFTMGIAGRRSSPRVTVLVGFGAGLIGAVIFLLIQRPPMSATAFFWGTTAGLTQGLGWLAFSRALFLGPISLVAPLAAATTTVSLYAVGLATGNHINVISGGGALLALCAIILLSRPREIDEERGAGGSHTDEGGGVIFALTAGLMFTLQSLALNQAGTTSSSVVIVGAGVAVVVLMSLTLITHPLPKADFVNGGPVAAVGGLVIFFGDVSYLYALNRGPLTTASVLGQLHPLFTVILAQLILRERFPKIVAIGVACALIGAGLIATS